MGWLNLRIRGRGYGKVAESVAEVRESLDQGRHIHMVIHRNGIGQLFCIEGPQDCSAEHLTLEQMERKMRGFL